MARRSAASGRASGSRSATSFGIGLLATLYAGRLEQRVRRQQVKDAENTRELQQLSAKLITAQEEERRSIARELHDEVGQVLTAIKVELAVAQRADRRRRRRRPPAGRCAVDRGRRHCTRFATCPTCSIPRCSTIWDWPRRSSGTSGDSASATASASDVLHDRMDERLTPEIEAAAYRIVQEALTNVAKHARATACRVYLQRLPNTVLITDRG